MAKKRVFIGSASESKDEAAAIARVLADNGYQPLRWWQEFRVSLYTVKTIEVPPKPVGK